MKVDFENNTEVPMSVPDQIHHDYSHQHEDQATADRNQSSVVHDVPCDWSEFEAEGHARMDQPSNTKYGKNQEDQHDGQLEGHR